MEEEQNNLETPVTPTTEVDLPEIDISEYTQEELDTQESYVNPSIPATPTSTSGEEVDTEESSKDTIQYTEDIELEHIGGSFYKDSKGQLHRKSPVQQLRDAIKLNEGEPIKIGGIEIDPNNNVIDDTLALIELGSAIGAGPLQYFGGLNTAIEKKLTGQNRFFKKIKRANPVMQSVTDVSSLVVPMMIGSKTLTTAATTLHGSKLAPLAVQKLGNDAAFKAFSKLGLEAGVGAFVDSTNQINYEDDNLAGSLKKMFPKFYQWIPDTWATNDTMSPDQKMALNRNEGIMLSIFSDILLGTARLVKNTQSLNRGTKFVPKNRKANEYFKNLQNDPLESTKFAEDPITDQILRSQAKQERSLDELAEYHQAVGTDTSKATRGVHDVFDPMESATRSVDPDGVVGATVDQARIVGNLNTSNGRLGSIISEAAMKFGLRADSLSKRVLVQGVLEHIRSAGKYDHLINGKVLSWKQIDEAGTALAQTFLDPRMEPGTMKAILDELKDSVNGIKNLNDVAYDGAFKSIKGLMEQFGDMDVHKAQAYLNTSLAGQASDMAEGMRLMDGTNAVGRAQEMILDRMEYLMVEKGLASWVRGSGLANINIWKRIRTLNDPKKLKELSDLTLARHQDALASIIPDTKSVMDELRTISAENPEFLRPLMLAYEFSDGNIDSMYKLNNFVRQSLGTVNKAFLDGQPEIPSILMRSVWSNIYNSALSAFATPLRAGLGNIGGIIAEPVSVFAGALLSGDIPLIKRGLYVYGGVLDTLQKATEHMGHIYRKAATDPTSVGYIVREDIALKNEEAFETLNAFANAASVNGEDGARALLNIYETQEDLAQHPWLRFGANSMTALDGFTRAFKANGEAKARAFDLMERQGKEINTKSLREVSDKVYSEMFDGNGLITDSAVDYASREIALNLDSELIQGLNTVLQRVPALKPWLMFPRTSMNMLEMFHKYSPASILAGDMNKIGLRPLDTFDVGEINEILTSKGIPIDEFAETRFRELRAKVRGRVAIGTSTVMTAGFMFTNDRLRGNGHHDPQRQRNRKAIGWKPRTYKGWDGKWYSYDGMGPISDWLALTADVMDNFDLITSPVQEEWLNKMAYILGANLTSKSVLGQLEPMNDVLAGNPAALARWGASFANLTLPLGSQRAELARLFTPQLKELDMEFAQLLANRNPFAKDDLPDAYDYIDGKQIGYPENVFVRLWNTYAPSFKMHGEGLSKERQFLIDIEYDSRPGFFSNGRGVKYTPKERSELQSIMGKQGLFRNSLRAIMNTAESQDIINKLKELRRSGVTTKELKTEDVLNLYARLDRALKEAIRHAEGSLSNINEVRSREQDKNITKTKAQYGILPVLHPAR